MTDKLMTTRERAVELIAACWDAPESETVEKLKHPGAMAVIRVDTGAGVVDVVRSRGRDVNEAWANAIDKARKVAEAQVGVCVAEAARHEIAAGRAKNRRRRIIDVLNGVDRSDG